MVVVTVVGYCVLVNVMLVATVVVRVAILLLQECYSKVFAVSRHAIYHKLYIDMISQ